ncbi:aminopeptidase P N-terminal domain-containing protein [Klenkia taihuensis]|uniref:Xaa-Pro aminopeptidase n=1 Tax=Klenkia taihuensis TaxID=1225127 RepID=A0A1I1R4E7_9ACTN|nr:aminopeptidase P N-terminal domain-containing protein [Klenkia taihuensis]GHE07259.1 Xaa-Pro aminopeptidase 2 [Klenkia taihuensis]SFD29169.1 Xaa-Pro aminopeptidase [Klenkia taihuensis]
MTETPDATRRAPHDQAFGPWVQTTLADGWDPEPEARHPAVPGAAQAAAAHRARLLAALPGRAVVVPSGHAPVRANDTVYGFRPASAYTWLTGDQAEGAVLVLRPDGVATVYLPPSAGPGTLTYVTDRREGALWVGGVPSARTTAQQLQVQVRPRTELAADLAALDRPRLLGGVEPDLGAGDPELARTVDRLRAVKDDWEVDRLAEACAATARGFADVARELPGLLATGGRRGERWLEGTFWRRARLEGNDVGYSSIVAAGAHGTSLHWAPVDGDIRPGELLLADMGVETTSLYTADVTRTFPVDGTWTGVQRRVHGAVHEAHHAGIAEVRAGNPFLAAHLAAQWVLADHLHRWGLIEHTADDAVHPDLDRPGAGAHRRYTLHSTSHLLGLDVHDCAKLDGAEYLDTVLEPGHCLTVEPGLYFQVNDRTVPAELRGLAVRLEDDLVVTDGAPRVLSDALPTDADGLTAWLADAQAQPFGA